MLVTHDFATMTVLAYERMAAGLPTPGVIITRTNHPDRELIEDLLLIAEAGNPAAFENDVRYAPIR